MMKFECMTTEGTTTVIINDPDLTWPKLLNRFIAFLNGCEYVIDPVRAEEAIEALVEQCSGGTGSYDVVDYWIDPDKAGLCGE